MALTRIVEHSGEPPETLTSRELVRVASVPSSHVYIRHLTPDAATGYPVVRLADPDPDDTRRSAVSRWWPPAMLDPRWVHEHASEFDLFHLQFGFDARTPDELRALTAALREEGKPFVYTVHDLRNPHHADRREHDAQLDVLIPAADALVTLTPGAAAEIERRWKRTAHVLPHPHVVDLPTMRAVQAARRAGRRPADEVAVAAPGAAAAAVAGEFRIGVHVKSLRASMNPLPVVAALVDAVAAIPGARLQVDGHSDVLLDTGKRFDPALAGFLRAAERRGELELRVHDFFTDAELWAYLASLDVSVLPYRFGTHSGWLEACHDLGTAVIAPDCGYYADQGPVFSYHHDERGLDAGSLVAAVRAAAFAAPASPASIDERVRQRDEVAAAHLELYRGLLG
ncbi:glycosyltransferase family 1 protein [Herbiconiux daphne]|uniref:Glycosyltransferase family 1 protein n=1 Tax=Herbiconiux daphne TaxID=2970914 RepID=A0ABT2H5K6_9MICO|nr:glycosyltransferase family 1 protein [Herbiconiux daphne]MCS5735219.1 glycosyltransferase family 1 protein [Herbiconiux daphne]